MTTDLRDKAAVEHKLWAEIEDTGYSGCWRPLGRTSMDHFQAE